jgi:hypothetical protein
LWVFIKHQMFYVLNFHVEILVSQTYDLSSTNQNYEQLPFSRGI